MSRSRVPVSLLVACLFSGTDAITPLFSAETAAPSTRQAPTVETSFELSSTGRSAVAEGTRSQGRIATVYSRIDVAQTSALNPDSSWSIGAAWQSFSFRPDVGSAVPEHLASLALNLGYQRAIDARWSLRADISPGLYGDFFLLGRGALSAPAAVNVLYAASRDIQWIAGIHVDPLSGHPVIGGAGVRWQITPAWNLLLVAPAPRIEYAASDRVTVFAGLLLRRAAFRVGGDFGDRRGRPELDRQNVGYRELTARAGVRWQLSHAITLDASAGWLFDRRFEFADRDLLLNGDGAPAFQVSLAGAF